MKKLILIIGLVLLIVFAYIYFTRSESNDENSVAAYGRFENDHFISEYIGLDIDMSDRWVYFTAKTLSKSSIDEYAEDYGVDISALYSDNFFLTMLRPGVAVCFVDNEELFSKEEFTKESVEDFAYLMSETFRADGTASNAALINAGVIKGQGGNDIANFTMRFSGDRGQTQYCTYAYFNTEKTGIVAIGVRNDGADETAIDDLLKQSVKVIYTAGEPEAA